MIFKWESKYSVGDIKIDGHHIQLFNIIERLGSALDDRKTCDAIEDILFELKDYTVYHFTYEEVKLEEVHYPKLLGHKKEHDDFVIKLDNMIIEYQERKDLSMGDKTYRMLVEWLINHILKTDRQFINFIK